MRIDNQSLNTQLAIVKAGRALRNAAGTTSGFLLEERDNHLALVSSNLVSETSCLVKAIDVKGASAYLPGELAEIVEKCSGDPVQLKLTATRAEVTIGGTKAKLPIRAGDVFPRLAVGQELNKFSINSSALKKALNDTINFAPTNDTRSFLNGVLMVVRTGSVLCVATNGHMMSISTEAAEVTVPNPIQRILPVAAVRQLLRILEIGAVTEIVDGDNAMLFKNGLSEVRIKPIQGRYLNWQGVLEKRPAETVAINRVSLQQAISTAKIFADSKNPVGVFEITPGEIRVSSTSDNAGESSNTVSLNEGGSDQPKKLHANLDYMQLAVDSISTDEVRFSYFNEDLTAVWLRKAGADDRVVITSPYKA